MTRCLRMCFGGTQMTISCLLNTRCDSLVLFLALCHAVCPVNTLWSRVIRAVLGRANAWLAAAAGPVKLVSCEALDVDGVYRAEDDDDDVTHHVTVSARRDAALRTMPAFVRVLRWVSNVHFWSTSRACYVLCSETLVTT